MAFELFEKRRIAMSNAPAVTIQKRGNFSLNARAHAELGEPEAVELLYDPDERLIGIKASVPERHNAYTIRPSNTGSTTYMVAGIAFATYYGLDTTVAKRWTAEMRDGMLIIDLKEPGTVVTSNRSRAKAEERSLFPS